MPKLADIEDLVRTNIKELEPYHSARGDYEEGTLLDANENSFGSPLKGDDDLNRYPSPDQRELRSAIADFRGVRIENVFAGVGSDESIDLLIRIFCEPAHDRILVTAPTYGMYKVSAEIHDVFVDQASLASDYSLDPDAVLEQVRDRTKIIFLCSPNNPTGNDFDMQAVKRIITEFNGIVVLDEAYVDFSSRKSLAPEVVNYPNLVVLQTFSKAFGMAGIRLGAAIAVEDVIKYLNKIKAPYNLNRLTARYGIEALEKLDIIQFNIDKIIEERERLAKALSILSFVDEVYPSEANFILFRLDNAGEIQQKLADRGIIVRYRGDQPNCENCLRVTVGTPNENDLFLSTLKKVKK